MNIEQIIVNVIVLGSISNKTCINMFKYFSIGDTLLRDIRVCSI
jgi:hypothetical protein